MGTRELHELEVNIGPGNGLALLGKNISWANIDTDLCHHMVSLGHNEWNTLWFKYTVDLHY